MGHQRFSSPPVQLAFRHDFRGTPPATGLLLSRSHATPSGNVSPPYGPIDLRSAVPRTVSWRATRARAKINLARIGRPPLAPSPSADVSRIESPLPRCRRTPTKRCPRCSKSNAIVAPSGARRGKPLPPLSLQTIVPRSLASAGAVAICPLLTNATRPKRALLRAPAFSQLLWRASGDGDGHTACSAPPVAVGFGISPSRFRVAASDINQRLAVGCERKGS